MSDVDRSGWIVTLSGKQYATWPYVLNEAHKRGLMRLECELIQIPGADNGNVAIVRATAEFGRQKGDNPFVEGRYTCYGDASPGNVNARMTGALIRLAETRAKGRCLRDACDIGMTLLEELPDDERRETNGHGQPQAAVRERVAAPVRSEPGAGVSGGRPVRAAGGAAEPAPAEDAVCEWPACGRHLTQNNRLISQKNAARDLCPEHLTEFRKAKEQAAAS